MPPRSSCGHRRGLSVQFKQVMDDEAKTNISQIPSPKGDQHEPISFFLECVQMMQGLLLTQTMARDYQRSPNRSRKLPRRARDQSEPILRQWQPLSMTQELRTLRMMARGPQRRLNRSPWRRRRCRRSRATGTAPCAPIPTTWGRRPVRCARRRGGLEEAAG